MPSARPHSARLKANNDGMIQRTEFLNAWRKATTKRDQADSVQAAVMDAVAHPHLKHVEPDSGVADLLPVVVDQPPPLPVVVDQPPPLPELNLGNDKVAPAGPSKVNFLLPLSDPSSSVPLGH